MKKILLCLGLLPSIVSCSNANIMSKQSIHKLNSNTTTFEIVAKNNKSVATTNWKAYYSDKGFHVEIEYIDEDLYYDNTYSPGFDDNFEFLINLKSENTSWTAKETKHFLLSPTKKFFFDRTLGPNQIGENCHKEMGVVLGENLDFNVVINDKGFVSKVFIAYDLLGTTYEEGYGNLTICPAIRNTHTYITDSVWVPYTKNGCSWSNPSSFMVIK